MVLRPVKAIGNQKEWWISCCGPVLRLHWIWILCRISDWSVHSGSYIFIRLGPLRWAPLAGTRGLNLLIAVRPVELAQWVATIAGLCLVAEILYENILMTSSNGNIFSVTGPLCGEFTGHQWIPLTKASDVELCCFFHLCLNNGWINNAEAGDLRRHRSHYDVIIMLFCFVLLAIIHGFIPISPP